MAKIPTPSPLAVSRAMNTLLEGAYFPPSLQANYAYTRRHDDTNGEVTPDHDLTVIMSEDGDTWVDLPGRLHTLRFRTYFGGGQSLRVRNALVILAEAIRRDNEERPQRDE